MLKKYNNIAKKSKCDFGEILEDALCGRVPAEKLGHVKKFDIILHGREFSSFEGHNLCLDGLCQAPMGPMH